METVKVIHNGKAFNAEVVTIWEWARRMKEAQAEREKESAARQGRHLKPQ